GTPSWNYRFLRMALKQDPFVDLVSFVFLRTPTDSVDVPDNQLSLIPFPIDELFLKELKNFDVVFFDDFSHRSYFNALYLEKVRDFVREGGGLAMLGGVRSFDSGGYRESPLREVLPVELDGKGSYRTGDRLRGILTAPGKAHPITRLLPDLRANEEIWKKMPPLTSLNQVPRAKGETLLLAVPDGASGGSPLLTVGRFGKGRTLALMSDDFWRWNFIAVGEKKSPQNHLKLIRQAVRWLAQEPSFEQVQIRSIGGSRGPGERMDFKVRVLKDDFTPATHATLRLRLIGPEGEPISLEVIPEAEKGEYSAEFTPTREGSYRLEAEANLAGRLLGRDRKNFLVAFPYRETEDGRPRPDLLRQVAEISKGEFIPISEWNEKSLELIAAKLESLAPSEIVERRQIPLWSTLWTFSLLLILLSSEWWLRRKWGLI
ncbi:MAG: glutamine amidotransferase, partial [Candidatus Binatia bacterium]